jgi:flagella basal body P-ring formation protein FlgA
VPKDLILSGISDDIRSLVSLVKSGVRNQAKARIAVFSGGKEVGVREVTFCLKYNCRKLVAQVDIPPGAIISPENVRIKKVVSNYPEPADWMAPYGLITKRRLPANIIIQPGMVGPVEPKVLLKRNQNVVIKIDRLGILVTATGKTVQEGKVGEYIRVRNVDSKRIILAKVNEDGTVEPVF